MLKREITQSEQTALNIIASIVVVAINTLINFFLSPYIVKSLGVEANGYITLANNFVSYLTVITIALNSMAGRFMLIELRRNNEKEANEYYSSVFWGNWLLLIFLGIPSAGFIINIEKFINIESLPVIDVKLLFFLVFLNFFIGLGIPKWSNATYISNKLYLRSIKSIISAMIRAILIVVLFAFFKPYVYHVAIAGLAMTVVNTVFEYLYKIKLLPQLKVKICDFNFKKIKTVISSGIWNTVSSCGNILLEGLDILIANLFISPVASGTLALSKIIPNMLNQIVGSVTSTFGPPLTYLYADGKICEIKAIINKNIKLISIIANIPIGITVVMGNSFFKLWVPTQNENELALLSSLALLGTLIIAMGNCINNVFIVVNKLRFNSIMVIIAGLLNAIVVYLLLKTTDLGIYAIAGVSSVFSIIRIFGIIAPYAARCINERWYAFYIPLIKGVINVVVPMFFGIIVTKVISTATWLGFFIAVVFTGIITLLFDGFLVFNKEERYEFLKLLHIKK